MFSSLGKRFIYKVSQQVRKHSVCCGLPTSDPYVCGKYRNGLIIGVFSDNDGSFQSHALTKSATKYNELVCNRVRELLEKAGKLPKFGELRIFYDLDSYFSAVAVVGMGPDCKGYNNDEQLDEHKESIRVATSVGAQALFDIGMDRISTESFDHAESAAEGVALALYLYQDHKSCKDQIAIPVVDLWNDCDWTGWQIGLQKAAAQNLARQLSETPANYMTPTLFAQNAVELLCKTGINVEVKVQNWAKTQGMGAFLMAARGSCQTPIFLELSYLGTGNLKDRPIVLIGKGNTFDSGGIDLSHPGRIQFSRGDMSGAAVVVATMRAIASLHLPINVRGLIPLCENMPGCNAMKPGDVAVAMNGKSIMITDTRVEGRLMLADTLVYSQQFWPLFTIDVGTMTKGMRNCLSTAATGVFTNSDCLWKQMRISAAHTGDRVWRMPLFKHYALSLESESFDIDNIGPKQTQADPCRCAAFLKEFVPCGEWMHMDIFGVSVSNDDTDPPYIKNGLTGRPTRTLIEFISQTLCQD